MKQTFFFLLLLLLATSCATIRTTNKTATGNVAGMPVYYAGNGEPVATSEVFMYPDGQ
jgi:hypothetical protein